MPKIRKKRVGFVMDMTPLVDITFLLLTFFMFTAKFKSEAESEQKFQIKRPTASADTSKLPDKDLATIKIAIDSVTNDTSYYYAISNDKVRRAVFDQMTNLPEAERSKPQVKVDLETLDRLVAFSRPAAPKMKYAVDCDKRVKYKWVEDMMDVMRKNRATIFNFVTEKRQ